MDGKKGLKVVLKFSKSPQSSADGEPDSPYLSAPSAVSSPLKKSVPGGHTYNDVRTPQPYPTSKPGSNPPLKFTKQSKSSSSKPPVFKAKTIHVKSGSNVSTGPASGSQGQPPTPKSSSPAATGKSKPKTTPNKSVVKGSPGQGSAGDSKKGAKRKAPVSSGPPAAPLLSEITAALDKLQKRDKHGIFAEPVTEAIAPDYFKVISHPMDFSTMRAKAQRGEYRDWSSLKWDVETMYKNATTYNPKGTVVHHEANTALKFSRTVLDPLLKKETRALEDWQNMAGRDGGHTGPSSEPPPKKMKSLTDIPKSSSQRGYDLSKPTTSGTSHTSHIEGSKADPEAISRASEDRYKPAGSSGSDKPPPAISRIPFTHSLDQPGGSDWPHPHGPSESKPSKTPPPPPHLSSSASPQTGPLASSTPLTAKTPSASSSLPPAPAMTPAAIAAARQRDYSERRKGGPSSFKGRLLSNANPHAPKMVLAPQPGANHPQAYSASLLRFMEGIDSSWAKEQVTSLLTQLQNATDPNPTPIPEPTRKVENRSRASNAGEGQLQHRSYLLDSSMNGTDSLAAQQAAAAARSRLAGGAGGATSAGGLPPGQLSPPPHMPPSSSMLPPAHPLAAWLPFGLPNLVLNGAQQPLTVVQAVTLLGNTARAVFNSPAHLRVLASAQAKAPENPESSTSGASGLSFLDGHGSNRTFKSPSTSVPNTSQFMFPANPQMQYSVQQPRVNDHMVNQASRPQSFFPSQKPSSSVDQAQQRDSTFFNSPLGHISKQQMISQINRFDPPSSQPNLAMQQQSSHIQQPTSHMQPTNPQMQSSNVQMIPNNTQIQQTFASTPSQQMMMLQRQHMMNMPFNTQNNQHPFG